MHASPRIHTPSLSYPTLWIILVAASMLLPARPAAACHGAQAHAELGEARPLATVAVSGAAMACTGGMAGAFPCKDIDLLANLPTATIGGGNGNDLWGWTDLETGKEYALMGRTNGTAFVDISDPENPVYLGNLPTASQASIWRDIKTYGNHAFVVADAAGAHGMQIFDLTELRAAGVARASGSGPITFEETIRYEGFREAHNLVINTSTGFAYAVGGETCSGGAHMVDVRDPLNPVAAGCIASDGETHDSQCVIYDGPDTEHIGKEICLSSNEDTLTIVDVTAKDAPVQLARASYNGAGFTHQGWLSPDHSRFVLDDEADEITFGHNAKTYLWDVTDLDAPVIESTHMSSRRAIDHNQYVVGVHTYQASYRLGLRVLRLPRFAGDAFVEEAFFDTYPEADGANFNGAWSVYPFFASGTVIVSDVERGLFVLRPRLTTVFFDGFEGGNPEGWSFLQ